MGDSYRFTFVYCGCRDAEFNWVSIMTLVIYATVVTRVWVTGRFATKSFRCWLKLFRCKDFCISSENIYAKRQYYWKCICSSYWYPWRISNLVAFERAVSSALLLMQDIKFVNSETWGFPRRGLMCEFAIIFYCPSMGSRSFVVLQVLWSALNDSTKKLKRYLTRLTITRQPSGFNLMVFTWRDTKCSSK